MSQSNLEAQLQSYIKSELESVLDIVKNNKLRVEIPSPEDIDLPVSELARLVAESSNAFSSAARLAGIARANAKLAKGAYERVYKRNRGLSEHKNDKAREAYAMEQAEKEHSEYVLAEAIADLADAIEAGARVASESARKLYDRGNNILIGEKRAESISYPKSPTHHEEGAPW